MRERPAGNVPLFQTARTAAEPLGASLPRNLKSMITLLRARDVTRDCKRDHGAYGPFGRPERAW
jgi:hypothetical protein